MRKRKFVWSIIVLALAAALLVFLSWQNLLAPLQPVILILAAVIAATGLAVIFHFVSAANKLRLLLPELEQRADQEAPDTLQESYIRLYELYMRLAEKKKPHFYGRLMKLREKLEEQMKAQKKVEELLQKSSGSPLPALQQYYEEMHASFRKLPAAAQKNYYSRLMQVKEVLEKGR